MLSMPLWYNSMLGTKFDVQLSRSGFNYLRDIVYHKCKPSPFQNSGLQFINQKIAQIKENIPDEVKGKIAIQSEKTVVIYPIQTIKYKGKDMILRNMKSKALYKILVAPKVRIPKGLLNWCLELELSDEQIKTALTFAHQCSLNTFDRVFQYKITTYILPTNEYLFRYRVKNTDCCDLCEEETDTIVHRLFECEFVIGKTDLVFSYLRENCNSSYSVTMIEYLFGKNGEKYNGLNHLLLELKKTIFYSNKECLCSPSFVDLFWNQVRNLIKKEKIVKLKVNRLDEFEDKWKDFTKIYDFRGPDEPINM